MQLEHLFFVYMFVVLAVAAFDLATCIFTRGRKDAILGMEARLLGFVVGIGAMVAIKMLAGSTASVF